MDEQPQSDTGDLIGAIYARNMLKPVSIIALLVGRMVWQNFLVFEDYGSENELNEVQYKRVFEKYMPWGSFVI